MLVCLFNFSTPAPTDMQRFTTKRKDSDIGYFLDFPAGHADRFDSLNLRGEPHYTWNKKLER